MKPATGPRDWPCEAGELELDDGTCQPAGVPDGACGQGFASDGENGCVAILPDEPCGPGTFAIPGETSCHEVAPCGSGTWGDIPVDGSTQHVDGSYAGGDSDGTAAKPWPTIAQAIAAAEPQAIIALAAGSYAENLVIQGKAVRLWGKCPAEVAIVGETANGAVVFIHDAPASGSELRDLAITGGSTGVLVEGAADVVVDRAWIHDVTWLGLYAYPTSDPATVTMSRSLVEGAVAYGSYALGATLTLTESVIRDTAADVNGDDGAAVYAVLETGEEAPATLAISRCLLERQSDYGVRISSSTATIEDTLIRNTAPEPSSGDRGQGVRVHSFTGVEVPGAAELRGVVIEDSHECGLCALNADVLAERVVVRDVAPPPADHVAMPMLMGIDGSIPGLRPTYTIRSSLVERGNYMGLGILSSDVLIEGVIVRDVEADTVMGLGRGMSLESDPSAAQHPVATLHGVVVERTTGYGIALLGAEATMESIVVRDVSAEPLSQIFGRGIGFEQEHISGVPTVGELRHAVVERATEFGVAVIGSDAQLDSLTIRDTQPRPLDDLFGRGLGVQVSFETMRPATASLTWSLVERSCEAGIVTTSSDVLIRNTLVRESGAQTDTALFGDGIVTYGMADIQWYLHPATATLNDVIVESSERAGVSSWAAEVSMGGVWLDCNAIDMNGETIQYYDFSFTNAGGNRCGCGDETWPCQVLSSNLAPPPLD